jgi:L,D-transpeptidase ErfK/SrfK
MASKWRAIRWAWAVRTGRRSWGRFTVVVKVVNPAWDVPLSIQEEMRRNGKAVVTRVPPGPQNPLGRHWIGLSVPGYGIHGTNAPASISKFQSHGCIRLKAADIADLFARVHAEMGGISVYEPILLDVVANEVWLQAHPDVYRRDKRDVEAYITAEAARLAPGAWLDVERVRTILRERSGRPHPVATIGIREP